MITFILQRQCTYKNIEKDKIQYITIVLNRVITVQFLLNIILKFTYKGITTRGESHLSPSLPDVLVVFVSDRDQICCVLSEPISKKDFRESDCFVRFYV